MELGLMEKKLKEMLTPHRFEHSLGVQDMAVRLAERYGGDRQKAALAGLVHDCAKDLTMEQMEERLQRYALKLDEVSLREPALIHGPLGACVAQDLFQIDDQEILGAICYHTTGRENMTLLEKIIYLADFIEPCRDYPGVERLRQIAWESLDRALLLSFDNTIAYVISLKSLLHPNTILARNYLLMYGQIRKEDL